MAEEIDLTCCPDTEPTNPKRDLPRRTSKGFNTLFRLKNPMPDELKDSTELKKMFNNWNLVPFAGNSIHTSHTTLEFLNMLYKLSPTHNAAVNKKVEFAVGGKARVVRAVDPEFEIGDDMEPVKPEEARKYVNALKTFIEFEGGVSSFHNRIGTQFESNGNSFVELSFASVMGQGRAAMRPHRTTHCMYLNTKPGENRAVAVSPVWTDAYLKKNAPRVVPLFPVFREDNGVYRTMFHLKNGDNSWYGRPSSEGSDVYKYREVQDEIYQVRAAGSDFTGQIVFEVEDDNPQYAPAIDDKKAREGDASGNRHSSFMGQLEQSFTQRGEDPQTIFFASRPYGSKQMFVFQVMPNTKESWYKETGIIASDHILRSHRVTPRFLGFNVSNGFAVDVEISNYMMYVEPTINKLRDTIMNFVNAIVTQAWELVGQNEWNVYSLTFASPIQSTVDQFKSGLLKASTPEEEAAAQQDDKKQENPNPEQKPKPDPNNDDEND